MTKPVTIYTTPWCPYCRMAKSLLGKKNIEYKEIDVTGDPQKRQWLLKQSGQNTVPQIFIGEKSIGGFTELSNLERNKKLEPMLIDET